MRPPRTTVRRAMVAVAVIAIPLAFWSKAIHDRRLSHLSDAAYHARREAEERANLATIDKAAAGDSAVLSSRSISKSKQASLLRVPYHASLKEKYEEAASKPWMPLAPDPIEPGEYLIWESLLPDPLIEFHLSDHEFGGLQR